MNENKLNELIKVVLTLRGPNGCPWDKEQTFDSMCKYILEEGQELVNAIKSKDYDSIKDECGDVLLHVVMLAIMGNEENKFSLSDVIQSAIDKMIRRHPHVFGNVTVKSVDDVLENWEKIKQAEKS